MKYYHMEKIQIVAEKKRELLQNKLSQRSSCKLSDSKKKEETQI